MSMPSAVPVMFLLALTCAASLTAQEGRPFTPDDALALNEVAIEDVSDDGRWVAASMRVRRDRLNVDHMRYGDPTYLAPSRARVLLIDTRSGERRWLHDEPVHVRALTWSPDGTRLAYFLLEGDEFRLRVHDAGSGATRDVDPRTDKAFSSGSPLLWAPDGHALLLALRPEGWAAEARSAFLAMTVGPVVVQDSREDFLAWDRVRQLNDREVPALVSVQDGGVRELPSASNLQDVRFSADGTYVTYLAVTPTKTSYTRRDGSSFEVFKLNLAGGEPESLLGPTERRTSPEWTAAADAFAWTQDGSVFVRDLRADSAVDLTERHRQPLSAEDTTKTSYSFAAWSPDGQSLLVTSDEGWHVLDRGGDALRTVLPLEEEEDERPEREVQSWTDDGAALYFSYSAPDRWERGMKRLDVATGQTRDVLVDDALYRSWNVSDDGGTIVYEMSDGDRPNDIWVLGPDRAGARRLTDANPQLEGVALARSELVEYLDADGNTLYGILYYPFGYEAGRRYPLVAEIYEDYFDNGFNESMNLITAQGWFGFRPSVEFEEGYPGEAWLKGVTAAVNEVIDRGLVDADRLGVQGTSYGGYAVNLLITQTDRFAAAVNISGKVNIISFLGDSPKITTRNYAAAEVGQDRLGATLWEQPHKYVAHSAVMFADRIDTPLLMLSGEGDWNVPATNQREMYYALRRLEKEVVWVHYMNAGHGAGRAGTEADFRDHWRRLIDWYAEHFGGRDASATTESGS
jgi:dipeptidyl aminopeptidase/acylaminoacyl peptidase